MLPTNFLFLLSLSLLLIASGCAAPASGGWSGIAFHGNTIYVASVDGKVLALNSAARNQEALFPASREWVFTPRALALPTGFGCAPPPPPSIYGTPAVAGDLVYFGTYLGKVYAVNSSARMEKRDFPAGVKGEWEYPRQVDKSIGSIVGQVVVANNSVYVGSSNGVYALDAKSGDLKWHFKTGGKAWTTPEAKGGVVYVGDFDGKLYALSAGEGKELWGFQAPAAVASSATVFGDMVIFGCFDRHLYAVTNGKERWKFRGGNWFWAKPIVSDDIVYAGNLDRNIYALKVETGEKLWQFEADSPIASSPILMDDFLMMACEAGKIYIVSVTTGKLVKTVSLGSPVLAPLYGEEGVVYVHAKNRNLYAVKIPGGEIVWKFSLAVKEK